MADTAQGVAVEEEEINPEEPQLSEPNLGAANPREEALRQQVEALQLTIKTMVASAAASPSSHQLMIAPVRPFTGEEQGPSANDFASEFKAKAVAAELPRNKWVPIALATMGTTARTYCEQHLAKLAQESDDMEWEAGWSDLLAALKAGPWAQQATVYSLRTEMDDVRLQPRQAVRVVTRKLDSFFYKLAQAGDPIPPGEKIYCLQRAVRAQLQPLKWPINAHPATNQPWSSYEELSQFLVEKDATEPDRCRRPLPEESSFQQPNRRRERAAPAQPGGKQGGSSSSAPAAKKPRTEYAGTNKLAPEVREQLMAEGKCFRCKQPGHRASEVKETSAGPKFVCPQRSTERPPANSKVAK